eukprot:284211-Rhodomonas_salina.3
MHTRALVLNTLTHCNLSLEKLSFYIWFSKKPSPPHTCLLDEHQARDACSTWYHRDDDLDDLDDHDPSVNGPAGTSFTLHSHLLSTQDGVVGRRRGFRMEAV